jgi:hypothetical protein
MRRKLQTGVDVTAAIEDGDDQNHLRPNTKDDGCAFLVTDPAHIGEVAAGGFSTKRRISKLIAAVLRD